MSESESVQDSTAAVRDGRGGGNGMAGGASGKELRGLSDRVGAGLLVGDPVGGRGGGDPLRECSSLAAGGDGARRGPSRSRSVAVVRAVVRGAFGAGAAAGGALDLAAAFVLG